MQRIVLAIALLTLLSLTLVAKVPIIMTKDSATLAEDKSFSSLFQAKITLSENDVLSYFLNKKANFALIRKDVLEKLSLHPKHRPYFIIGELSKRMKLLFLSKKPLYKIVQDLYHKKIIVNLLSAHTSIYLKKILKTNAMQFDVNILSMDIYRALNTLKEDEIDAIFTFSNPPIEEYLKPYIQPYPQGFIPVLENISELTCNKEECAIQYYLIASEHVGKAVMHNIYVQLKSLWSKEKHLLPNIGNYYIDTTYKKSKKTHSYTKQPNTSDKPVSIPKFGRSPWMDVAIKEAILGKGSAENLFPMLDLSYKYIRFSKGEKGITTAPNDNKMGSWCAAYICWTLDKSGFQVHTKGRMASQSFRYFNKLYRKIDKPIFGAITVYTSTKNPQHGHVGYLFGRTPSRKNILLGGNQNNRLKFAIYPTKGFGNYKFNGFYVPIDYIIKPQDYLTKEDIYSSSKILNIRYGIQESKSTGNVR